MVRHGRHQAISRGELVVGYSWMSQNTDGSGGEKYTSLDILVVSYSGWKARGRVNRNELHAKHYRRIQAETKF